MRIAALAIVIASAAAAPAADRPNVVFIIADDLTLNALSCYGNPVCKTPNIDRLAASGTRFTRAYCQATYCGPSRASFLSGYYPHATGVFGYVSGRAAIGPDRATWPQHFKDHGYHTARVSKIFHMGVPGDIEKGSNGTDDPASWTERFNSPGPEWKAPGEGETLEGNPDGKKPVVGGNTFVVVVANGDDLVHSDGKTAAKACELIRERAKAREPFFLAVGFVRPHVPFVAPESYFPPFLPYDTMTLPEKVPGDWDDIPKSGINYKTSQNMKMDVRKQKKAVGGYYAVVAYMDAQVGKVLTARNGRRARRRHDRHLLQRPRLPPRRTRFLGQGQPARGVGSGPADRPRAGEETGRVRLVRRTVGPLPDGLPVVRVARPGPASGEGHRSAPR